MGRSSACVSRKAPGQVGAQHIVPVRALHRHHQPVAGDAGVVHQDLDLAEALEHRFGAGLDRLLAGYIQRKRRRLAAGRLNLRHCLGQLDLIPRRQRHGGASPRQFQRARPPDSLRSAGHQRNSSLQICHMSLVNPAHNLAPFRPSL
jgi:hypothetical protein